MRERDQNCQNKMQKKLKAAELSQLFLQDSWKSVKYQRQDWVCTWELAPAPKLCSLLYKGILRITQLKIATYHTETNTGEQIIIK